MLYCYGDTCPIKHDCYRHTQPIHGKRGAFVGIPYIFSENKCEHFVSNTPKDEMIRIAAYHIWLREGRPEGCTERHWHEAYESLARSTGKIAG